MELLGQSKSSACVVLAVLLCVHGAPVLEGIVEVDVSASSSSNRSSAFLAPAPRSSDADILSEIPYADTVTFLPYDWNGIVGWIDPQLWTDQGQWGRLTGDSVNWFDDQVTCESAAEPCPFGATSCCKAQAGVKLVVTQPGQSGDGQGQGFQLNGGWFGPTSDRCDNLCGKLVNNNGMLSFRPQSQLTAGMCGVTKYSDKDFGTWAPRFKKASGDNTYYFYVTRQGQDLNSKGNCQCEWGTYPCLA
jgi:hypothetical protein